MQKPKEGMENFIIKKLEKAHTMDEICAMLKSGGFSKEEIERGILHVKKNHKTLHQDLAASNNFLPSLNKGVEKIGKRLEKFETEASKHIGLFSGRMRRKDFIVSILFLFSLFFSIAIVVTSFIQSIFPESWSLMSEIFSADTNGVLCLYIPVLFAPFTLVFLSLTTRRLHDLNLPGILSFLFLGVFIYPFSEYASAGVIVLDVALFILFIFLLSEKGDPAINIYGKSPVGHGSTFTKILNLK